MTETMNNQTTKQALVGAVALALQAGTLLAQSGTGEGKATAVDPALAAQLDPPTCPAWARVAVPEWVRPFQGPAGAPEAFRAKSGFYASGVAGIDRYQANNFIWYRPETAEFLYKGYTPLEAGYRKGLLPGYEAVVSRYTAGCATDTEKALALLTRAIPDVSRHPTMPPLAPRDPPTRADRNLDDEALLASGRGWCNEQARVFIRLCQVSGIPARMIHLWGQNHTIAEFYADGRWVMADATNLFVGRDPDGKLLSAAECHDGGVGQHHYAESKVRQMREMAGWPRERLGFPDEASASRWRVEAVKLQVDELAARPIRFGVINYPLPTGK